MLNISLMQCYFFWILLEFIYSLAGFQSNIKEVQEKFHAKFSHLRAKPQILRVLKLQYDVNKIFACASVANEFVKLKLFSMEKFFCLETVTNGNYYIFLIWAKRKPVDYEVLRGFLGNYFESAIIESDVLIG